MGMRRLTAGLFAVATLAAVPGVAQASDAWDPVSSPSSANAAIKPDRFKAFTLDQSALKSDLSGSKSKRAAGGAIISVPAPDGGYQRFQVKESSVMAPALAARHPEIKTYEGVGLDDQTATISADDTPLGFHASVRSSSGAWYVDPYYHLDDSVYISYFAKDVSENSHGASYVEEEPTGDPLELGVTRKPAKSAAGPEIQLRTFRLAMVTDPTYATYFGGSANVTAAKVTLINRVDQIYQDETAIKLQLIADTDKLN